MDEFLVSALVELSTVLLGLKQSGAVHLAASSCSLVQVLLAASSCSLVHDLVLVELEFQL